MLRSKIVNLVKAVIPRHNASKWFSASSGEDKLRGVLMQRFPEPSEIVVQDISGGCGAMYAVFVASKEFSGLPIVKQHKLVKEALKQEIKEMHGIRVQTEVLK